MVMFISFPREVSISVCGVRVIFQPTDASACPLGYQSLANESVSLAMMRRNSICRQSPHTISLSASTTRFKRDLFM